MIHTNASKNNEPKNSRDTDGSVVPRDAFVDFIVGEARTPKSWVDRLQVGTHDRLTAGPPDAKPPHDSAFIDDLIERIDAELIDVASENHGIAQRSGAIALQGSRPLETTVLGSRILIPNPSFAIGEQALSRVLVGAGSI